MPGELIVVTGAGGFIGGHLVRALIERGARVRAVDFAPLERWHQRSPDAENLVLDLRRAETCEEALLGATAVYNLAADMGGMAFIEANKARCMLSVLISAHLLEAARGFGVERFFFASSACVYAKNRQRRPDSQPLKESDAYPLSGRHEIEVWGDGEQTRTFMYVDDCVLGTQKLMASDFDQPLNLGSSEPVTINQLIDIIEQIAGITVARRYELDAPKGVRGRNSDNSLIREQLGWEPSISLHHGLEQTYRWIYDQASAQSPVT